MRIDMLPTDCCGTYKIRPGIFLRNGASIVPGGVNFSVYSSGAKACELVLFWNHAQKPFAVIPFPESYRVGNVFAMIVFALDYENLEYGFRIDGTWNPLQGELYDGRRCLLDPYVDETRTPPELMTSVTFPILEQDALKGIVGLEITMSRIEGKWKVSQNRPEGDRKGVAAGLAEAHPEMAALVRRYGRIGEGA